MLVILQQTKFYFLFCLTLFVYLTVPNEVLANVCRTDACYETGKWLASSVNASVHPCTDFYQYACGQWSADHKANDSMQIVSHATLMKAQIDESIGNLLLTSKLQPHAKMIRSIELAKNLYRECLNEENRNRFGVLPIKKQLSVLLGSSWPIWPTNLLHSFQEMNSVLSFTQTMPALKAVNISPLISLYIVADTKKPNVNHVSFLVPSAFKEDIEAGRTGKTKLLAFQQFVYDLFELFSNSQSSYSQNIAYASEVNDFSTSLFLAQSSATDQNSVSTNLTNFKTLTLNKVNWKDVLKGYSDHFGITEVGKFPQDYTTVFVADLVYYRKLADLLFATPRHVLLNFLGAYFALTYSDFGDARMQEIAKKYVRAVEEVNEVKPLWSRCLRKVRFHFDYAISKLFIDEHQLANLKAPVEQLVEEIRNSFLNLIENHSAASWLDAISRKRVWEKVQTLKVKVLTPDWLLNDHQVDAFYGFTSPEGPPPSVKRGHFLESFIAIEQYYQSAKVKNSLYKNATSEALEKWPSSLTSVNAYAEWTSSTVYFFAGFLLPPYYNYYRPDYMNYAILGTFIGHEMMHHFDERGSRGGSSRNQLLYNYGSVWSFKTQKNVDQKLNCFIEQYGRIIDKVTGNRLNGRLTLNENIADSSGLEIAFAAYQNLKKNQMKKPSGLPQMGEYTTEQLFFLSFAQSLCSSYTMEARQKHISRRLHTLQQYRVNVALSNFLPFSQAFNCQLGTVMNPKQKCSFW